MTEALVALGGNIGDVRQTLNRAIGQFCRNGVTLLARSSDYRTPPWGVADQPPFVNCVIAVESALAPRMLLDRALQTEREFGRDRTSEHRWGPRPVDIDLLTYGKVVLSESTLTLPHPRLLERAFVLVPLAEIRPDLIVEGTSIKAVLATLDQSGIQRLPPLGSI
jgi:2-amino-4-hydroxy-6-hydroxymethyldihydropteridine diphosphokinase